METKIQLVIVTGMSGAGKTVAIQSFEDLGYFTIDNMPPTLVPKFIELIRHSQDNDKIAMVVDMRSRSFFTEIREVLDEVESSQDLDFKILFLDATDSELIARAIRRLGEVIPWHLVDGFWMVSIWNVSS